MLGFDAAGLAALVGFDAPAFAAAGVPDFAFAAVAGFLRAVVALEAVPAFGFAVVVDFAFGLRVVEPASRARCVRVVPAAEAPVLVPPARGVGAGVSVVVSGSLS